METTHTPKVYHKIEINDEILMLRCIVKYQMPATDNRSFISYSLALQSGRTHIAHPRRTQTQNCSTSLTLCCDTMFIFQTLENSKHIIRRHSICNINRSLFHRRKLHSLKWPCVCVSTTVCWWGVKMWFWGVEINNEVMILSSILNGYVKCGGLNTTLICR